MEVTLTTGIVAISGLLLACFLAALQLIALLRPRSDWVIRNVYGGHPDATDARAYFAFNQGFARADPFFWLPMQVGGSFGMLLGQRWGFLLGLMASVPFWYSAILIFVWDRDLGFRENSACYWLLVWGIWPLFGVLEGIYCFARLLQ